MLDPPKRKVKVEAPPAAPARKRQKTTEPGKKVVIKLEPIDVDWDSEEDTPIKEEKGAQAARERAVLADRVLAGGSNPFGAPNP